MTEINQTPEHSTPTELHDSQLANQLRLVALGEAEEHAVLLEAAAARIERFNRLSHLLGKLAPAGTAPCTALEQIYKQSDEPEVTDSPIIAELRTMLVQHWGEWTPAIAEAEGVAPTES